MEEGTPLSMSPARSMTRQDPGDVRRYAFDAGKLIRQNRRTGDLW